MEKFDVIVVGAGLAGLATAYVASQSGLEVLVLEKGDYPGAKNVTGGRLYLNPVRDLFPGLWEKAPLGRHIVREEIVIMDKERSLTVSYTGDELAQPPYQSCSVQRSIFDRWFAQETEKKGAIIVTKNRVDGLVIENGRVVGVWAGDDELRADVVVAADGVMSLLSEQAGLRSIGDPHHYAVGFKETIELDRKTVEERFNLEGDEGAARLFMGEVTQGKFGGGFLYTNKESISLGIVVGIKNLMEGNPDIQAPLLLEEFRQRPEIRRLLTGGQTVEYSAHVIPEGGLKGMGRLYRDGLLVVGDAAGLALNIGVTVRGMEYALASGYYAAQAIIRAKETGDYSAGSLKGYADLLETSFVMQDFRNFKNTPEALDHPRFFQFYPRMVGNLMKDIYEVPDGPKATIFQTVRKHVKTGDLWPMIADMRRVMKI